VRRWVVAMAAREVFDRAGRFGAVRRLMRRRAT
jgi:hypothetical protein